MVFRILLIILIASDLASPPLSNESACLLVKEYQNKNYLEDIKTRS